VPATYCGDAQVPPATLELLSELEEVAIELDDLRLELDTLELETTAFDDFELETLLTDEIELTDDVAPSQTPSSDHS